LKLTSNGDTFINFLCTNCGKGPPKRMNNKYSDQKLPLVVCDCGFKILIVPDLGEMARSIENHAAIHGKSETDPEKAEAEYCRVEELLTQRVLIAIAKKNRDQH